ncbi:MAG: hypothetical protein QGG34_09340 [SAR202 cluster bacterium]|jgi:galactonate dehydratase|nr:hypothetical protein [SAR202 cluster bacterium]MDP7102923.1 hypothetical protein [SAR202 cluster bacterium]MDP7225768.1 hypothetical protein [SAR202 cluster bacterium]MDP7414352.1 hypothetical protein [SAR202 cluster bacterium]MDP7532677.1 hypothetical protein [SAR202 cluster bacterium]|tara:strand:+ start:4308 stop:5066 length:759 start_codon:yes stop_codon:yes gene_type:complete
MKITGLKTNIFSSQHRNAKRNWLIVRLQTDEGIEGIGESSMFGYDPLVAQLLQDMVESFLIGKDPMAHELHWMRLHQDNNGRGGRMFSTALSGIDLALWDLRGKALGVPVYTLLGGPIRDRIRVYANGWYTNPGTPEQNAEEAKRVVAMGYTAMKFDPFGQHNYYTILPEEAQLDEDRVAAVREAVGPNVEILVEVHAEFYEPHYFEVFDGLPRQKDGYVDQPTGPGLGLTFNEEVADAHPYVPLSRGERGI